MTENKTKAGFFFHFTLGCSGSSSLRSGFPSPGEGGRLSSWGSKASHCGGVSGCGTRALELAGFRSCGSWALEHRLSSCSTQAQLLRGIWDLPGPGIKPLSPALAGGFFTTELPGKPTRQGFLRKEAPLAQKGAAFGCHREGGDISGTD